VRGTFTRCRAYQRNRSACRNTLNKEKQTSDVSLAFGDTDEVIPSSFEICKETVLTQKRAA
jgi:hypothetical protein